MSVSKRKTAEGWRWRYDFERGGQRYNSPETYSTEGKARRAETAHKKLIDKGAAPVAPRKAAAAFKAKRGEITVGDACDLYWRDTAQHLRSANDVKARLEIVKRLLGAETALKDVGFAEINEAIQKRRTEGSTRYKRPLTGAGINRDIIDTFRPARKRAALVHTLALPEIAWGELRLKEAGPVVREFDLGDVDKWGEQLKDPAEKLYLALALTYGPRRGELFFSGEAIRADAAGGPELDLGRYYSQRAGGWRESRKDGSVHTIALDPGDAAALLEQAAHAEAHGCPHVWCDAKGKPISYYGMGDRLEAAAKRAGVEPGRIIHGMRHHAGTTMARHGGLALAQRLLGHKKAATTERYTHLNTTDLRAGMAAIPSVRGRLETTPGSPAQSPAQATPAPGR